MCDVSRDLLKFSETSDNISSTVQDRDNSCNGTLIGSYVAYLMASLPMPLNNLEVHICRLKPF